MENPNQPADLADENGDRVAHALPPLPLEPLPGTSLHNLDAAGVGEVSAADYATGLSPKTLSFDASEQMEPATPPRSSRGDDLKAHLRAVLAAQPFRGNAVHKDDLLAVIDALIDGPDAA